MLISQAYVWGGFVAFVMKLVIKPDKNFDTSAFLFNPFRSPADILNGMKKMLYLRNPVKYQLSCKLSGIFSSTVISALNM